MNVATLVLLALSAAASIAPIGTRIPWWSTAVVSAALLGAAAITGAIADPAQGLMLAVTYIVTLTAAVAGGSAMVTAVFRIAQRDGHRPQDGAPGPLHGGRTIGILERAAVAASVLTGWPEGIAIVLAVKGLARYPELRADEPQPPTTDEPPTDDHPAPDRPNPIQAHPSVTSASEQFIIGTFTSVMWAVAVCGTGYLLTI
jgi:hypothetical protein